MKFIKKLIRWLRFHFIIKKRFKNRFGSPQLCNIVDHNFHDSKFEKNTCLLLESFFPSKDILIPSQHKYATKFDFIVKDLAIVEPHGVWNSSDYFSYYKKRKELSEKNLINLPIVIIPSYDDLSLFESLLNQNKSPITTIRNFQLRMFEKYSSKNVANEIVSPQVISSLKWKIITAISWVVFSIENIFLLLS